MKYKVGDRVKIKSLEWYNSLKKDSDGDVYLEECHNYMVSGMADILGKTAIIEDTSSKFYNINLDNGKWLWNDEMFEEETVEEYAELINIANNSKNNVCTTIDYEQRRYEIAKAILTGYSSGEGFYSGIDRTKEHCERAIMYADELIRQLKQ